MGTRILVTRTRIKPHSILFSVDLRYGPHIYLDDLKRLTKSSFRHQSERLLGLPKQDPYIQEQDIPIINLRMVPEIIIVSWDWILSKCSNQRMAANSFQYRFRCRSRFAHYGENIYSYIRSYHFFDPNIFGYSFVSYFSYHRVLNIRIFEYIRIFSATNIRSYHIRILFLIRIYSDIRSYCFFQYEYIRIFVRIKISYSSHYGSEPRPSWQCQYFQTFWY